jgi:uncharacterized membrane protein
MVPTIQLLSTSDSSIVLRILIFVLTALLLLLLPFFETIALIKIDVYIGSWNTIQGDN